MTNVNATVKMITPLSGATLSGYKLGWLVATVKAAADDTITITNASVVDTAFLQLTADGTSESNTIATNVITLTKAVTTGTVQGLLIYTDEVS
jgi:hypothetical protein